MDRGFWHVGRPEGLAAHRSPQTEQNNDKMIGNGDLLLEVCTKVGKLVQDISNNRRIDKKKLKKLRERNSATSSPLVCSG